MEKGHINKVFGKKWSTYYLQARPVFQGLLWARLFKFNLKKREGWFHCSIKSLYHSLNSHNHIYWYQSQLILLLNTMILGLENIWVTFNIKKSPANMLHKNVCNFLNSEATKLFLISKDGQWHCESFEIWTNSLGCISRPLRPILWDMLASDD